MKSIIIVIALFLVTLTAKADWVKSGELDSLYLGDAPITFSKYSPDYTKFVTYSALDSTLRLWDLQTGKVIKDRTFEKKYQFNRCEFDFESEMFVFTYTKSYSNTSYSNYIAHLNFSKKLIEIELDKNSLSTNPSNSSYLIGMRFYRNILILYFSNSYRETPNGTQTERSYGSQYYFQFKNDSLKGIGNSGFLGSSIYSIQNFQDGSFSKTRYYYRWYGTHAGPINQEEQKNGLYIDFNGIVFNQENTSKTENNQYYSNNVLTNNYPYLIDITPLDIAFKYLVFNDIDGKIKFFSGEQNKLINLNIGFTSKEIRKLMLIESPQYSLFYKEKDTLNIYDNKSQNIIAKSFLPEGTIAYDKSKKIIYTANQFNVYKSSKVLSLNSFADIWTNTKKYLIGDSVRISSFLPLNVTDASIEIEGTKYSHKSIITIKTIKTGYYKIKLNFTKDGINKSIVKDSLFLVLDSLKVKYKITNTYNNNVNYPFYCEASSNDPETVFTWGYSWCQTEQVYNDYFKRNFPVDKYYENTAKGSQAVMNIKHDVNKKSTPFILKSNNGIQSLIDTIDLVVNPNLAINFNKYSGNVPFTFKAIFENIVLKRPLSITHQGTTYCALDPGINKLVIGDVFIVEKEGSETDSITGTITKPGRYKITLKHSFGYQVTHDSVITVYDPSDIQDFAERKYIFKQDAEGIYCQLEGEGEVSLYDNVGRLVRTYQIENERYIPKEDLERGVYFLSIQTDGNVYHEKVLVE